MAKPVFIPNDINWELLKRFNVCANSFGFNEAAKKIGTSPSALLGQIEVLEKQIGFNLFERVNRNRSKTLTPEGQMLKEATQQIFLFLSTPMNEQKKLSKSQARILRVITTEGLAKTILVKPINQYLEDHPDIQLQLITKSTADLIEPGEVVIRSNFVEQKHVRREYLLNYKMKLYASKTYINKFGRPASPLDLSNHKVLIFNSLGAKDSSFLWKPDLNIYLTPTVVSDSFDFLLKQCYEGQGIFELADLYLEKDELVDLFPDMSGEQFDLYLSYNKKSTYEDLIPDFVKFLKKSIGDKAKE